jgi:hypothetical protein
LSAVLVGTPVKNETHAEIGGGATVNMSPREGSPAVMVHDLVDLVEDVLVGCCRGTREVYTTENNACIMGESDKER